MAIPILLKPLLGYALPPRCAGCGDVVADDHQLCVTCWQSLDFLPREGCTHCGTPMEQEGMTCGPCLAHPPVHDGVRAEVRYGGLARDLAVRLKHGRRIGLAQIIGRAMARQPLPAEALLVPVPLHRWRIWQRGFNQALLIARVIGRQTGHALCADALLRPRRTPKLGGLGRVRREKAMRGAIAINPRQKDQVRGRHIVLVDDVYTSGATSNACARVLKRSGAASVTVLAWARVILDDSAEIDFPG